MAAHFEIKIAKNGDYMFNLFAPNGRIVATSETYTTLQNCKIGIESVKRNSASHTEDQTQEGFDVLLCPKYEIYNDKEGKFRFRLRASNGEIICASQGYSAKQSALDGIESIKENAPIAETVLIEESAE